MTSIIFAKMTRLGLLNFIPLGALTNVREFGPYLMFVEFVDIDENVALAGSGEELTWRCGSLGWWH